MMGKIPKPGKSFRGCILYCIQKHEAVILDAMGVRTDKAEHTIMDFNMQRKMNPGLGQAVGHISLSWSPHDRDKLTPEVMVELAKEYMEEMNITGTQYLIIEHKDRPHPHVHIVYNRVDNNAKTISDKFQQKRNVRVCKDLTLKHGFYISPGKEQVNRERLKGADKIKYELFDAISGAVKRAKSWDELQQILQGQGIGMQYKFRSGTTEIQGISFSKGAIKFKGSEIDRCFSFGRLNQQFTQNAQSEKAAPGIGLGRPAKAIFQSPLQRHPAGLPEKLIGALLKPGVEQEQPDIHFQPKKKRKKRNQHL